ncbi:MAG: insulinase family protein [Clostridia bacterium]|nr:insulinase family protein [Clostridia bacterium]
MRQIIAKHHFTYKQVKPVEELGGRLWELEHEKSGAKLVWLDRPEENMAFAVSFKTIPENGTGVFHILEHSVLCGSERYPVKEPFVELLKSSLKTFLNAFTAFDNTTYPVASCNRQDYLNLVKVYMDAVFHPRILTQPEIFLQEGWRYEFDGEKPQFQGVVYNEMKGAYSSVDRVMYIRTNKALFPDTCYCHDSGGDPAEIPSLTYEAFIANYRKYYHPSNARIVLDGTVDLDAVLDLLDGVLSAFDRQEMDLPIPMQQPLPYHEEEDQYEIGASEEETGR